jgi:hypothetical protein
MDGPSPAEVRRAFRAAALGLVLGVVMVVMRRRR